jgi:hypothetical protein
MSHSRLLTLTILLPCLLSSPLVSADTRHTLYFGLGGGKSFFDDGDAFAGNSLDKEDEAWTLNMGWYLSANSAIEFGYRELGNFGYKLPNSNFQESVKLWASSLTGIYEIKMADQVKLVPRLGLASVSYYQSFPSISSYYPAGVFGLGVRFEPLDNLAFELLAESFIYQLDGSWVTVDNGEVNVRHDTVTQLVTQTGVQVLLKF